VYNGASLLAEALEALLNQTFEDFEVLVLDNVSTDATEAIARDFAARDPRVRYVRNDTNIGSTPNFNRAVELARGRFFRWHAHDDLVAPTYLEKTVPLLLEDDEVVFAFTKSHIIWEDGRRVPYDAEQHAYLLPSGVPWRYQHDAEDALLSEDPCERFRALLWSKVSGTIVYGLFPTSILRRSCLLRVDGNDGLLLCEVALMGRFRRVDEALFSRRIHPDATFGQPRRLVARREAGGALRIVLPPWRTALNYVRTVTDASISRRQKVRCLASIVAFTFRPDALKQFVVPGPQNYFGIHADWMRRRRSKPRREAQHV